MSAAIAIVGVLVWVAGVVHCIVAMYAIDRRMSVRDRQMRETLDYIARRAPPPRHLLAYMGHVPPEPRKEWWWRYGR